MSTSYIVSALIACGLTCVIGAFGMRVYFVRNREIADREDPRDTQIRDLQATLQVTRKDTHQKKTAAEDTVKHLEFAHDRINELLENSTETKDKLDACKELLRAKIAEREQLHDKFVAAEREANTLKERLEDAELELSMSDQSGDMLESGLESAADGPSQATAQSAVAMPESERTKFQDRLATAQTELETTSDKLSRAENEINELTSQLQETQSNQSGTEHPDSTPGDAATLSAAERKEFEEKLSATQDRVFVAEGKLAAVQKESAEKLTAAQAKLAAAEKDSQERLAAAHESVSAAEAKLAAAHQKVAATETGLTAALAKAAEAETRLIAAQENVSAAQTKLVAARDRISATEGKLSTVQERISAAEGKMTAAENEAEARLAAAREKLGAVEKLAEERIAAAKNKILAVEKAAQDKLAAAEVRLSATEKVAKNRVAAAQEKLFAAEANANERLAGAQDEVDRLRNRLQEVEQKLSEAEETARIKAETQEYTADIADSDNDDDSEMYTSSVEDEDGSPSLIHCLNEELDRWKRHCHVLGDELKQQREHFAEELAQEEDEEQFAGQPANDSVSEEPRLDDGSSEDPGEEHPAETQPEEGQPATPQASAWSSEDANGNGSDDSDELTDIRGIGKVIAGKLHELGIYRYEQLAALNDEDVERVQGLIPDFERRMRRDKWMEQARTLHSNKYSEQI